MLFDFLDDAFLLNLAFETPQGALDGLTFKYSDLGQSCLQCRTVKP